MIPPSGAYSIFHITFWIVTQAGSIMAQVQALIDAFSPSAPAFRWLALEKVMDGVFTESIPPLLQSIL